MLPLPLALQGPLYPAPLIFPPKTLQDSLKEQKGTLGLDSCNLPRIFGPQITSKIPSAPPLNKRDLQRNQLESS